MPTYAAGIAAIIVLKKTIESKFEHWKLHI